MVQAGAVPITWIGLSGEWQRDWARESTLADTIKIVAEHGGGSGVAFAWEKPTSGSFQAVVPAQKFFARQSKRLRLARLKGSFNENT